MLKNYLYEIFELANANDKPVDVGVDLLVHNIENVGGPVFYPGAEKLNYAKLAAQWEPLTGEEKAEAKNEVREIILAKYDALCAAFRERDKVAFAVVVAEG